MTMVDTNELFGVSVPWKQQALNEADEHVPEIDENFDFVSETVFSVLMGFALNRRVLIYGPHGSGKSTHIEQVAARLNWPCVRVNLDGHVSRGDLIGRDMIVIRDGKQVTEFVPGILVWAIQRPLALIFDEYDAGRPDVMFVIQRVLESDGKLTLLDQNQVIHPHPQFRLFATANTLGSGDSQGIYAGTQVLNQAQLDRWHVITQLSYMNPHKERQILKRRVDELPDEMIHSMVTTANLCREAYRKGELSILMSLRSLVTWGENFAYLKDQDAAFRLSFLNRCDPTERELVAEIYQRCFGRDLRPAEGQDFLFE